MKGTKRIGVNLDNGVLDANECTLAFVGVTALVVSRRRRRLGVAREPHERRRRLPELTDDELAALPGVLHGSPRDIADTLREYRDRYRVSYLTESHAEHIVEVIAQLR